MTDKTKQFFGSLDCYINKYYKCLLIDGAVKCFVFLLLSILLLSIGEFIFHFSSLVRLFLFLALIVSNVYLFSSKVLLVILRWAGIFKKLSYEDACRELQFKDENFHDYLINILELSKQENNQLVQASTEQKLSLIGCFEFDKYLSFEFKSKFLILLPTLFVFTILFVTVPKLYINGFIPIFHFIEEDSLNSDLEVILKNSLLVEKGSDLLLEANLFSDSRIKSAFISFENNHFLMNKVNDTTFSYNFRNINNSFVFSIESGELKSKTYFISVFNPPLIADYRIYIKHPSYIKKNDTVINNQNILNVPQGTLLKYAFIGKYYDTLFVKYLGDSSIVSYVYSDTTYFSKKVLKDDNFLITLSNANVVKDFMTFKIISTPDAYPEIKISKSDALSTDNLLVFDGNINDDYGFSKMIFCVEEETKHDTLFVPILHNVTSQKVFYNFEKSFSSTLEDRILNCHFEVFDNDGVNGPKKAVSETFNFVVKSIVNRVADKEEKYDELFDKLEESKILSEEIKHEINELRRKSIDNQLSEWGKKNAMQQIQSKTNILKEMIQEITRSQNQMSNNELFDSDLVEKQKQLNEIFNSLLDDELKQMLEQIANLAKDQQQEKMAPDALKRNIDDFKKSLDRNLDLLKKVKLEENIKTLSDNLEFLSENHKNLDEESSNLNEQLNQQQKVFDDLSKQYDQILDDNNQLDKPLNIENYKDEFDNIKSQFDKEKNDIENGDLDSFKNKANENAQNLSQLSKKLAENIKTSNADNEAEVAEDLRQLLDNLFELSFSQEKLIVDYQDVNFNNPAYSDRIVEQSRLIENFKITRDSLYSLSCRSVYLGKHISSTAFLIEDNMVNASLEFQERSTSKAVLSQRHALSKMNDLILLLSESLKDIDNAAASSGGQQMKRRKQKPKKDENSLSEMRSAQESLKEQMRNLLNQMKSGDSEKINQQIAKSLMQNEIYQQMLQQMYNSNEFDDGISKLLREVKEMMEKNHSDLANKKLSIQTIMRQQNIVTKLLEAENAENERDKEEKRIATTGKNITRNNTEISTEDIKFENNIESLKQTDLRLNSYYKAIFDKYINGINSDE